MSALTSFPPKLSTLVKTLAAPEDMFEEMVRSATGFELPPGPGKMLASLMEGFEAGAPALPGLPGTPSQAASQPAVPQAPAAQEKTYGKVDVELF